jgi:hypothetical protein
MNSCQFVSRTGKEGLSVPVNSHRCRCKPPDRDMLARVEHGGSKTDAIACLQVGKYLEHASLPVSATNDS